MLQLKKKIRKPFSFSFQAYVSTLNTYHFMNPVRLKLSSPYLYPQVLFFFSSPYIICSVIQGALEATKADEILRLLTANNRQMKHSAEHTANITHLCMWSFLLASKDFGRRCDYPFPACNFFFFFFFKGEISLRMHVPLF